MTGRELIMAILLTDGIDKEIEIEMTRAKTNDAKLIFGEVKQAYAFSDPYEKALVIECKESDL